MSDRINVTLNCLACGTDNVTLTTDDEPATDESVVRCKACGHEFGRYGDVKAKARKMAASAVRDELKSAFKGIKGLKVK